MDLMDLLKLAGIAVQSQQVSSEPSCGCGMGESEGAGFDEATTEPNPAEFPDGISTLGSVSDTSLRRYLKARGDHVTVDEDIYPDYAVEDVAESYKAFAEKAKNPYAVGMAQAMKSTGDEPPLKKSTIKKAHDIAKAVNEEGSSNLGDTYMKHLHTKYNDKKSLSKSEAKEVKDLMTRNTIADIKKLAGSGIRHVSDAAKDHLKRYVPSNMKKASVKEGINELDHYDILSDLMEKDPPEGIDNNWSNIDKIDWNRYSDDFIDFLYDHLDALAQSQGERGDNSYYYDAYRWIEKNLMRKRGIGYYADKKTNEASAKPDFLDIDKDGNKKEPMKKAAKDKKQVGEAAKPDYIDIDGDGDKKEPMKKAAKDKEETKANESLNYLKKLAGVA
jgi:hypothetical protein